MAFMDWLLGPAPEPEPEPETVEERSISISDPVAFAEYFNLSGTQVSVTDHSILGHPPVYRAVSLISGTIASLPLKTYRRLPDGTREEVRSFLDNPAGPYPLTPFAWKELVMVHLLTRGEAFLLLIRNNAGALIGLWPVHPSNVEVRWVGSEKEFKVQMADGSQKVFGQDDMLHVMAITLDGTRGISPLSVHRTTFKTGIAGDQAAEKLFTRGPLIAGLITPESEIDEDEAREIRKSLDEGLTGIDNAGKFALMNKPFKVTQWTQTHVDAQWLESRQYNVQEVARIYGVPPHLLMDVAGSTSWGSGLAEQVRGLQKFTLAPWTARLEEALSTLLPAPRYCEFEWKGLLAGSPSEEIDLLIKQVEAGLLTLNEARAKLNLPALDEEPSEAPRGDDGGSADVRDPQQG